MFGGVRGGGRGGLYGVKGGHKLLFIGGFQTLLARERMVYFWPYGHGRQIQASRASPKVVNSVNSNSFCKIVRKG